MPPESSHLRDSRLYGQNWAVEPVRSWFTEPRRIASWLEILAAIAQAQADLGPVPRAAADDIERVCTSERFDLERIAERSRATGHSTTGLLEAVGDLVGAGHARYVGLGVTVQDISDTWTALTIKLTAECLDADLRELLRILSRGALRHRDTVMLGRTHGQPGAPITFGFKQAQWGEELARGRDRLDEGRRRWETAQLGGSVGSLAFWGADAPALMAAFARRIALAAPALPWASARDCVAEFGVFAAWKAEWVALPDVCCAVTRASSLCVELLTSLEVHADRMHANVGDRGGVAMSEHAVRLLEPHLGRPGAYTAVRQAAAATQAGRFAHLGDALAETEAPAGLDLGQLRDPRIAVASAEALVQAWSQARNPRGI